MLTHIVKRGEDLLSISQIYGVSIRSIVDKNNITNAETYEGDTLYIPVSIDDSSSNQPTREFTDTINFKPQEPIPKKPSPFGGKRKRFFWS
ncbi:LysM peptidoglycan-binding domain-containing protein [Chengkuizengella sp. SCS-71B]|uniref:LysM peptidoglycan-binding domain-containing protein n=1 Tax=Chengkuizengella sp. SCS-71B TaxID=3115290 RepID=UPI0032C23F91